MSTCGAVLTQGKRRGEPCGKRAVDGTDRCRAHAQPDETGHPKKEAFLSAFSLTGVVKVGCDAAGIGRSTYYDWLNNDPEFAAQIPDAKENAIDVLVTEAIKRATQGKSDVLLMFMLKAADPARFNDRRIAVEHSGSIATPAAPEKVAGLADELAAKRQAKAS